MKNKSHAHFQAIARKSSKVLQNWHNVMKDLTFQANQGVRTRETGQIYNI